MLVSLSPLLLLKSPEYMEDIGFSILNLYRLSLSAGISVDNMRSKVGIKFTYHYFAGERKYKSVQSLSAPLIMIHVNVDFLIFVFFCKLMSLKDQGQTSLFSCIS